MSREILHPENEQAWLKMREADLTSTMVPALFGLSPYLTQYELYHGKKNGVFIPFDVNERMEKGSRMQEYAAQEIAIKEGWSVRRMDEYIRIPGERMGSSFDFEFTCPKLGKGIFEIKAVDLPQFKEKWDEEAPPHIEIQFQDQLEVADIYEHGVIGVFTGLYDYKLFPRDRDRAMGSALRKACGKFWDNVEVGIEPDPDFYRDGEMINLLNRIVSPDPISCVDDDGLEALASKYLRLSGEFKSVESEKDATRAEIHYRLGKTGQAFTKTHHLDARWTKESENKKGYRKCKIKNLVKNKF